MRITWHGVRSITVRQDLGSAPPPAPDRWVPAALIGVAAASYLLVALVGLVSRRNLWPYAMLPAILITAFLGLLAMRGGRPRAAAIGAYETIMVIVYGMCLTWTVQLVLHLLPPGSTWALLAAIVPTLPCGYAAWRGYAERRAGRGGPAGPRRLAGSRRPGDWIDHT